MFDIPLPQSLSSVSLVMKVVCFLETCGFCMGNEDDKYFCLQETRNGIFMDSTGKLHIYFEI